MSDGKQLEAIVATLERTLASNGFEIDTNDKVFDDDGNQIAEFDVIVSGKFGSASVDWLIECRDRPSSGAAPGSWIEQLVGRKIRFGFNKVTAVSTSGFSASAIDCANSQGIELRTVEALVPEQFSEWINLQSFPLIQQINKLVHVFIGVDPSTTIEQREALKAILGENRHDQKILRVGSSNNQQSLYGLFRWAVEENELFSDVVIDGPSKPVKIHVRCSTPDLTVAIETPRASVKIDSLVFTGELSLRKSDHSPSFMRRYQAYDGSTAFSDVVAFEPMKIGGKMWSLEMHKVSETGETHVMLRRIT